MISYRVLTCKIKFGYQRVLGFGMHPDIDVRLFFHQLHPKGDWAITRSVAERNLRYLGDVVIFVIWSIYVHIQHQPNILGYVGSKWFEQGVNEGW